MAEFLRREGVYLGYYFELQLRQLVPYYAVGVLLGSAVSVFGRARLHGLLARVGGRARGPLGLFFASAIGIASPLSMVGTLPLAASFSRLGVRDDLLAAFMMSSLLLNPQLIFYSAALGGAAMAVRVLSCLLCGAAAGLLVRAFCAERPFFNFGGFAEPPNRDTDTRTAMRFIKNIGRNFKATAGGFVLGLLLSAAFTRYVSADFIGGYNGAGVFWAATVGVPLYACGGATIPLLRGWLLDGMSLGSVAAFMLTGPATKLTNLSAVKTVLGTGRFACYLLFTALFALCTGQIIDLF